MYIDDKWPFNNTYNQNSNINILKNFVDMNFSDCQFLGKIDQGSALHWCFWFYKFSKCAFLRKFDQGSALHLTFFCLGWEDFENMKILKYQIRGNFGQGSALFFVLPIYSIKNCKFMTGWESIKFFYMLKKEITF